MVPQRDAGILKAVIQRINKYSLPALLKFQQKVESGSTLSELELDRLMQIIRRSEKEFTILNRHREFQSLAIKLSGLYLEIIAKASENESRKAA